MPITFELVKQAPEGVALTVEWCSAEEAGTVDPVVAAATGFKGQAGQLALVPGTLHAGIGAAGAVDPAAIRGAGAAAARAAAGVDAIAVRMPPEGAVQALAEGVVLGAYRYTAFKSQPEPSKLATVYVLGGGGARVKAQLDRGARIARAVAVARDLVNEPGGSLTAPALARRAVELGRAHGFEVEVLDDKAVAKAGLAGLVAVNKGSSQPARFVTLTYEPEGRARADVALVGKGITFDSGGLSLKTAEGMLTMKSDMGGAAAVLATLSACRDLGVKARVRGYLPLTDNMTGGDAQRVGDIIRYRNGRTVEVLNTDAEGRLILADALIAAAEEQPDMIVDLATLTGAQVVALGSKVAALYATDDGLRDQLTAAGEAAGEALWPLPLVDAYRKDLDSKVADLRNVTAHRNAGSITAALFLREFVPEGIPWAHLDIAGPAFADGDDGELTAGGTGFGVRTLLQLLLNVARPANRGGRAGGARAGG